MPAKNVEMRPPIELEVVRSDSSHAATGRPLVLNARRFIAICRMIERGASAASACRRELVSYRTFRRHVTQNPRYARRLREAEELRDHFLLEFHMANIARHAQDNLSASLWWLEHRHPNMFALRPVIRDSGDIAEQPLLNKISMEELVANARLAAEVAANPPPGLTPKQLTVDTSEAGG
jgi:terminase small subunit-like protein